ncbi:hypothetical protein TNCV_1075101 [Trichonephila clavipes]|uniref:Uncharacterized protein n=1 Tax=Trichonephila clavipes TaxID=2585209 RepID=A0A8X6SUS3_TRICX|nr:hypothetical protein TNCV_1075101 [Trichonephila clavipes]
MTHLSVLLRGFSESVKEGNLNIKRETFVDSPESRWGPRGNSKSYSNLSTSLPEAFKRESRRYSDIYPNKYPIWYSEPNL